MSCVGETLKPDPEPFPESKTVAGLTPRVEVEMASVAEAPPMAVGVKMICATQLDPALSVAPQVVEETENADAEGPVICRPILLIGAPPLLETVTACGEVATPMPC